MSMLYDLGILHSCDAWLTDSVLVDCKCICCSGPLFYPVWPHSFSIPRDTVSERIRMMGVRKASGALCSDSELPDVRFCLEHYQVLLCKSQSARNGFGDRDIFRH